MKNRKEKEMAEFVHLLMQLEPIETLGIVKMLEVALFDENHEARDPLDIIYDAVEAFAKCSKPQRKTLLNIMKSAVAK